MHNPHRETRTSHWSVYLRLRPIGLLTLFIVPLIAGLIVTHAQSGDSIVVPLVEHAPEIDGTFTTPDEYKYAIKIQLYDTSGNRRGTGQPTDAYSHLLLDDTHLYWLFDHGRDRNISIRDQCTLDFDMNHNGRFDAADKTFYAQYNGDPLQLNLNIYREDSAGLAIWEQVNLQSFDAKTTISTSPDFLYLHHVWEGKISRSEIGIPKTEKSPNSPTLLGFKAAVENSLYATSSFPQYNPVEDPPRWADLSPSSIKVPEFSHFAALLTVAVTAAYGITRRSTRPHKR
ncbi:MAG: hypothetical protein V1857_00790 [archaeon]